MGVFFYFYFLFFNTINLSKLFINYFFDYRLINKKKYVKIHYELYFSFFLKKKIKLNFFKKKNGFKFFFNSIKINFSLFFKNTNFSNSKSWFLLIYLFCCFLSVSNIYNILDIAYSNKFQRNKFIVPFIQFFLILCSTNVNLHKIFFLDFFKFTDFFFKRKNIFFFGLTFKKVYSSFFSLGDELKIIPEKTSFVMSDLKKNQSNLQSINDINLIENQNFLFLFNSFFSLNKKFFFLRNNEIFNKSRYSRNRQTYRTGVFWCIWLTVLTVIGLYFYFYIFLIKFTYIWFFFFIFIVSFFFYYFRSKIEKHFFF